jgi:hypothetical protein
MGPDFGTALHVRCCGMRRDMQALTYSQSDLPITYDVR